ncbi:MAG: hypothetical protein ACI9C3_003079, partial [Yoonia sp.]
KVFWYSFIYVEDIPWLHHCNRTRVASSVNRSIFASKNTQGVDAPHNPEILSVVPRFGI